MPGLPTRKNQQSAREKQWGTSVFDLVVRQIESMGPQPTLRTRIAAARELGAELTRYADEMEAATR